MAGNELKLQRLRTNDLVDSAGKQFELGSSWCEDFFGIARTQSETTIKLIFKPLRVEDMPLSDKIVELKLSSVTNRGDRKAYSDGDLGKSQIKSFLIDKLHLTVENNLEDYFAVYKKSNGEFYFYYVPLLLYNNFIKLFQSITPTVSIQRENKAGTKEEKNQLQRIYYGAPGTGKSYTIDNLTDETNSVRTTFHPDSDYASFVGAYKPTMEPVPMSYVSDGVAKYAKDSSSHPGTERKIVYKYVPQAFLKAYVAAWSNLDEPFYLVIEEINRGNCAQIFGDLFQLLDRNNHGSSSYAIAADEDIAQFLCDDKKGFAGLSDEQREVISNFRLIKDNGKEVAIGPSILNGTKLLLPPNLHIWATMNTSDQSLFPIDSAFKRRWD